MFLAAARPLASEATKGAFYRQWGLMSPAGNTLADELLDTLKAGMLCLADRGSYSFQRFASVRATGAQLLWSVKSNMVLARERQLPDGSYRPTSIRAQRPACRQRGRTGPCDRLPA